MQTFLPYADFKQSMACLDYRRLGKQRVEAWQILRTLQGQTKGWRNHPAVKMWEGYENALILYLNAAIEEWISRGYRNTMVPLKPKGKIVMPEWLGDPRLHASHRSKLLSKDGEWYARFGWQEDPETPYFWPVGLEAARLKRPEGRRSES